MTTEVLITDFNVGDVNVAEIVELIISPFNDIVSKAQNAAACSGPLEPVMFKAADTLRKEGQRALNRLVPLYQKIVKQHGADCVNAIKKNEDISRFHLELTDVLWEFDDYLSVEDFDEGKYVELQTLCRQLAPKIYNILVRMNIELLSQVVSSESPTSTSSSASSLSSASVSSSSLMSSSLMSSSLTSSSSSLFSLPLSSTSKQAVPHLHIVPESRPASPLLSESSPTDTDAWHPPSLHGSRDERDSPTVTAAESPWMNSNSSLVHVNEMPSSVRSESAASPNPVIHHASSVPNFGLRPHATVVKRQSYSSELSEQSFTSRRSRLASFAPRSILPIRESGDARSMQHQSPRQIPATQRASNVYHSENLRKPVNSDHATMPVSRPTLRQCVITESSSFRRYKGFCSGAQEILQGRDGVKQKQKPAQRTLSRVVAKCNSCSMELDYSEIETDLTRRDAGNLSKKDVGYRLRFLQKSHLPVKRSTDAMYGCIFCISSGFTFEESDATVFFTAEDLFLHLSRHPQPLPSVSGINVVYGVEVPYNMRNNYDLHFLVPPKIHPVHEASTEVDGRPTGIAIKETKRLDPQRKLGERDREDLQLAVGARITGIKWPPQYKGRKIFAWHDGNFASVASDNIHLIPPENTKLSKSMRSYTCGKAKWKFSMKSGKDLPWLKFDKGDTITNIGWEHPDHWCWCGMNSKGHWGIFPQAYIDPNTVVDDSLDRAS
ncbi:hypothetical protein E4U21_005258 [Claviceps maximensis]|nr:hypothetical protein E4U21_005258 [Claviceps maximensis]